ncbi:MAG: hypothetical protein ACFFFG_13865 [Candidatus Thorarchaeota archaeon]
MANFEILALWIDLLTGIICVTAFLISSFQQYRLYRKYPFAGLRFFTWGFLLATLPILTVVLIVGLRLLGMAEETHQILVLFYKFTFSIGAVGIGTFAIGLWNLQPRDPSRRWSATQIFIGGLVGFSAGAIFTTLDFFWLSSQTTPSVTPQDLRYGAIYIDYDILVVLGLVVLIALLVLVALRHIRNLQNIQKLQVNPTDFSTRWWPVAYISLILGFITLLLQRIPFFDQFQLALTFALPLAVGGIAFSAAFRRYPSLLAITSAKLSSLTYANPDGLTLYAFDFVNKETSYDNLNVLLGGMLAALNISLSETLESREGLSSIAFGDKLIHIHSTDHFVLYLITSEINPTIADLINLYAKRFDESFGKLLSKPGIVIDQEQFQEFSDTVSDLVQFAPLSF